jgi:hypothetical protein
MFAGVGYDILHLRRIFVVEIGVYIVKFHPFRKVKA